MPAKRALHGSRKASASCLRKTGRRGRRPLPCAYGALHFSVLPSCPQSGRFAEAARLLLHTRVCECFMRLQRASFFRPHRSEPWNVLRFPGLKVPETLGFRNAVLFRHMIPAFTRGHSGKGLLFLFGKPVLRCRKACFAPPGCRFAPVGGKVLKKPCGFLYKGHKKREGGEEFTPCYLTLYEIIC